MQDSLYFDLPLRNSALDHLPCLVFEARFPLPKYRLLDITTKLILEEDRKRGLMSQILCLVTPSFEPVF